MEMRLKHIGVGRVGCGCWSAEQTRFDCLGDGDPARINIALKSAVPFGGIPD